MRLPRPWCFSHPTTAATSRERNCLSMADSHKFERQNIRKKGRKRMKNGKLSGKVAVVTGASKGIGAGIAKHLATEGAAVVVNYASSKEDADKVVDEISKRGGKAIAIQGDVAKKKDIERLFAEGKKSFGKIDILVNNAGVYDFKPLEEVTETEFHREFNTNVLGLILATQEAAKHFSADGGSVINVSSVASSATPPNSAIYTATKGAVDAITRALAKELDRKSTRLNSSHVSISYAVFCLKKKKKNNI